MTPRVRPTKGEAVLFVQLSPADQIRLTEQVQQLADLLDVEWRRQDVAPHAELGGRWFASPALTTQDDYLAALHELGHLADARTELPPDGDAEIFEVELWAWRWAIARLAIPIHENAQGHAIGEFLTHEDGAVRPTREQLDELYGLFAHAAPSTVVDDLERWTASRAAGDRGRVRRRLGGTETSTAALDRGPQKRRRRVGPVLTNVSPAATSRPASPTSTSRRRTVHDQAASAIVRATIPPSLTRCR